MNDGEYIDHTHSTFDSEAQIQALRRAVKELIDANQDMEVSAINNIEELGNELSNTYEILAETLTFAEDAVAALVTLPFDDVPIWLVKNKSRIETLISLRSLFTEDTEI